ncbi:hypothetical protein AVEN_182525-1 [Araneus ventricosus]|uniref:Uncharacterized protein n=1 Tax=Araneus ventricosus TaxID=182803 RepID=A0A4Y2BZM9_ARAVE|nr:hypothetical protein AVEN_182525-1 [Araneus ventricosus]
MESFFSPLGPISGAETETALDFMSPSFTPAAVHFADDSRSSRKCSLLFGCHGNRDDRKQKCNWAEILRMCPASLLGAHHLLTWDRETAFAYHEFKNISVSVSPVLI